jgi:Ca2+-binding EF-hand superfamily protein
MGGGASQAIDDRTLIINEVENQKLKPLDATDIPDFDSAILEITKLRNFFHMLDLDGIKKGLESLESDSTAENATSASVKNLSAEEKLMRGQAIASVLMGKMAERFNSLHDSFLSIDTDKSGYLSQSEFQEACWNWGILLCPEDFELLNSTYSHEEKLNEPDKGINYREFIALMTKETNYDPNSGSGKNCSSNLNDIVRARIIGDADTMREAFKKVDRDGSGTVEREEMRRVLQMYNISCSDDDFEELFKTHDKNGDGKFSYGEFVQLIQGV